MIGWNNIADVFIVCDEQKEVIPEWNSQKFTDPSAEPCIPNDQDLIGCAAE